MSKLVASLLLLIAVVSFSFGAFIPVEPVPPVGSTIGGPAAGSTTGPPSAGSTTGGGVGVPQF